MLEPLRFPKVHPYWLQDQSFDVHPWVLNLSSFAVPAVVVVVVVVVTVNARLVGSRYVLSVSPCLCPSPCLFASPVSPRKSIPSTSQRTFLVGFPERTSNSDDASLSHAFAIFSRAAFPVPAPWFTSPALFPVLGGLTKAFRFPSAVFGSGP